jgi:hypothetical protein
MLSPMAINEHDSPGENERDPEFSQADLPRAIFELKNQVERLGAANRELTDKEEYKGRLKTETVGGAVQKCDILLKRKDVYGLGVVGTSTAQGAGGGASEATGAAGRGFGVGHAQEDIGA